MKLMKSLQYLIENYISLNLGRVSLKDRGIIVVNEEEKSVVVDYKKFIDLYQKRLLKQHK